MTHSCMAIKKWFGVGPWKASLCKDKPVCNGNCSENFPKCPWAYYGCTGITPTWSACGSNPVPHTTDVPRMKRMVTHTFINNIKILILQTKIKSKSKTCASRVRNLFPQACLFLLGQEHKDFSCFAGTLGANGETKWNGQETRPQHHSVGCQTS